MRMIFFMVLPTLQTDTEVTMAGKKLKELFEENLRDIFPEQTFPEIKEEATPSDSQLVSFSSMWSQKKKKK